MTEVDGQMDVFDCIEDVAQEQQEAAEAFKEKLAYWRNGGGVPMVLPSSFRAAG